MQPLKHSEESSTSSEYLRQGLQSGDCSTQPKAICLLDDAADGRFVQAVFVQPCRMRRSEDVCPAPRVWRIGEMISNGLPI